MLGSSGLFVVDTSDVFDKVGQGQFVHSSHDGTWTSYQGRFNSGTEPNLRLRAFASSGFTGQVYVDNFSLKIISDPSAQPVHSSLVANGNFEEELKYWNASLSAGTSTSEA